MGAAVLYAFMAVGWCSLGAASAWTNPDGCGRTPIAPALESHEDRVVGGHEAVPGSWPWHAGLHSSPFFESAYFCGGALISDRHVLTAAHCLEYRAAYNVFAHVGSHSRSSRDLTEQYVRAEHLCMHVDPTMDIGIVKLSSSVNFTDTVRPACLPEPGSELADRTTLYVTGWGQTDEFDPHSRPEGLKQVMTKSVANDRCVKEFHEVPNYLLCGSFEDGTPCQGDSGGPLVRKGDDGAWVLEGIVHKGGQLCKTLRNTRAMRYVKVSHFVNWVDDYMRADAEGRADSFCDMAPNFKLDRGETCDSESEEGDYALIAEEGVGVGSRQNMVLSSAGGAVALALVFWAAGFVEARSAPTFEQCGRPAIEPVLNAEDRILGGTEAAPGSWPWQAGFQLHHNLNFERHFCAGTLIDRRHVITASHCVRYLPPVVHFLIRVHLGSHSREATDPGEIEVGIEHACEHRASFKTYNDIAIIKLDRDVPLSKFIQPVCLPKYSLNDTLPGNTELYATGWGKIDGDTDGDMADVLRQLETRTLNADECQQRLSVKLLDTIICTEHVAGSTCHGDSGGPLVRRDGNGTWFLEGVISGGPRVCGNTKTPMRATRVSRYVRWIEEYRRRDAEGTLEDFCKPTHVKGAAEPSV
ncbi:transmembrane protease serine 9-like [Dermacentor albipictus]|uniref:transmembrane protease serine 9-like n=1 Tax=Dermacentor albipictus TaxID=60249 RepID=UPI0031FCD243